ncbi:MAG TPA: hypothetical protein DEQ39_04630 [Atlantibacter hermannii]|uniref:hypothetical protein n=1 Tax=Atlantibacter hermannii TaxID=565 RepID=UPI000EE39F7B|nr:hypothetical protein [Atlantibacter hermannii]HCC10141.1 hypothetical protein [Atlantibacter hermannii]
MTREQETLLLIKGAISELEPEQRERVSECTTTLNQMLARYPDGEALMAIALFAAQMDARA